MVIMSLILRQSYCTRIFVAYLQIGPVQRYFTKLTNGPVYYGQLFRRLHAALTQPPGVRDCCGDGLVEASRQANHVKEADSGL